MAPRRGRFALLLGGAIVVAALAGCSADPTEIGIGEGERLPDLELTRIDGQRQSLSEFGGRLVVLNVWAPWCAPCLDEMPSLQRLADRLDAARFAVIGLAPGDEPFLAEEFLNRLQIEFPNFIDRGRETIEGRLGVRVYPQTLLLGPDRRLLRVVPGWQPWDEPEAIAALEQLWLTSRPGSAGDAE